MGVSRVTGRWLKTVRSEPPYDLLVAVRHSYAPRDAAILDLGCGKGIPADFLSSDRYGFHLGMDVPAEAIARARTFDLTPPIEYLQCFSGPLEPNSALPQFLEDDRKFVVSMCEDSWTLSFWPPLKGRMTVVSEGSRSTRVTSCRRRPCASLP